MFSKRSKSVKSKKNSKEKNKNGRQHKLIEKNNTKSWEEIRSLMIAEHGVTLSEESIVRRAHSADIRGFRAIKKPS